ncbi:MAG TPA: hypothetical protein VJJ52_06435 [Candidatus Nanoarchaeia archaeon]|nr:hypothetical protein [Candidatus Nanoarchaeia archaeon]
MKKWYILFFILLFLSGCTTQVYIQKNVLQESIINRDSIFSLSYKVINPTDNTFVGTAKYDYNQQCLRLREQPEIDTVEVPPKTNQDGQFYKVREFQYLYRQEGTFPVNNNNPQINCFGVPLKITISLYDKSGLLKYSEGATLIITN